MMELLEAGHSAGLVLYTVDATTAGQTRPLPEWMFRLTEEETGSMPTEHIVPMALAFYREHVSNPELQDARFQVYFEPPE